MTKRFGKKTARHGGSPNVAELIRTLQLRYLAYLKEEKAKTLKQLAAETGLSYHSLRRGWKAATSGQGFDRQAIRDLT